MEDNAKKCTLKSHLDINAVSFCKQCKIYMCKKCEKFHSEMFSIHIPYKLNENSDNIFTGICKIENHPNELIYFCKNHNELCCASCITKIKGKGNGQHSNCNVMTIEEIKDEKKNKLETNLNILLKLSNEIDEPINELKRIFKTIDENKETLKISVQKIFTKIRTCLVDREKELFAEIDKKYKDIYFDEKIVKIGEKIPKRIKDYIEQGKKTYKEWNKNKLNLLINNCINIENNTADITKVNENIRKYNKVNSEIKFSPQDNELDKFIYTIKTFGNLFINKKLIKENKNDNYNELARKKAEKSFKQIYDLDIKNAGVDSFRAKPKKRDNSQ